MGKWILISLLGVGMLAGTQVDNVKRLCDGFVPENNLNIPVGTRFRGKDTGITEAQFNKIMDRMQSLYTAEVQTHGATYVINRNWTDGTVNAYAQQNGSSWEINMFGGLARYNGMTEDGMAAVACHETGHHLGGAPKYNGNDWAAVEGGADYYATLKCLKRYMDQDDNETIVAGLNPDPVGVQACEKQWSSRHDQLVCIRATQAGIVLGRVLQDLGGESQVNLNTPDPAVVTETDPNHPHAQCRLDTYFNGSLCTVAVTDLQSDTDPKPGSCWDANVSPIGLRPRCWYAPVP